MHIKRFIQNNRLIIILSLVALIPFYIVLFIECVPFEKQITLNQSGYVLPLNKNLILCEHNGLIKIYNYSTNFYLCDINNKNYNYLFNLKDNTYKLTTTINEKEYSFFYKGNRNLIIYYHKCDCLSKLKYHIFRL